MVIFQSTLYQTNSTVIMTDDVVMVVDPAYFPHEVIEIRDFVESVKGKRPVFLVFTHSDFDHIVGAGAFKADKIFASQAFAESTKKEQIIEQIHTYDHQYYITRNHPVTYPEADFAVLRDSVQYRVGQTRLTFYLTPGHTEDSMMLVVWQLGLCIAGDYLCSLEFPFIEHSSVEYLKTLEKLPLIHDHNWFTRLVPGHGEPSIGMSDWLRRRTEALAYIYALRESVATGTTFDEDPLWVRYRFPLSQRQYHLNNIKLITEEFKRGDWVWDNEQSYQVFMRNYRPPRQREDPEED
jgi:hydroxyacylglutathione hydrolase